MKTPTDSNKPEQMSATPRTDAERGYVCISGEFVIDPSPSVFTPVVREAFARQLETELAAERQKRERAEADAAVMREALESVEFEDYTPDFVIAALSTTAGAELLKERDSLRAEVERLRFQMKPENGESQPERHGEPSDFAGALRRMRDAEAEVARLREDGERLDWLERHGDNLYGQHYEGCEGHADGWEFDVGAATNGSEVVNLYGHGKTIRDAIDQARKEQP